ncbi:MAG TPA: quinone oxidoreductase [Pseudolabrys sp.]|nr:quinone oxidoreductase [Pseudolabrys sp.]
MATTKAVRFHGYGAPDVLRYEDIDVEMPGPGELLIRQTAIGVNFIDIQQRKGRYPAKSFPVTPGGEGAGVIEAVGEGVTEFAAGDRVAYMDQKPGGYCVTRRIAAQQVVKLPGFISDDIGASIMLKGVTANYLLRGAYHVRAGDTILFHAAAGGVGLIACQWAKRLGARVIGIVGNADKAAVARDHGCDHVIVRGAEDIVARVREITGGLGVPVVYDSVGAATFEQSLACLKIRGLLVSFGAASGPVPPFDLFRLNNNHNMGKGGSFFVTSASLADYTRERAEYLARVADLFEAVRAGHVRIKPPRRYALADAAAAHRDLESGATVGGSILIP